MYKAEGMVEALLELKILYLTRSLSGKLKILFARRVNLLVDEGAFYMMIPPSFAGELKRRLIDRMGQDIYGRL